MDTEEALRVADKAADRNTPAADHPSIVNMVYALEILASDFRTMREKAQAWERSYRDWTYAHDQRARKLRDARDTVQRLNELVEFMRTALGLDAHALDDPNQARKILGRAFADARLWARVKDMANGKFVAGDVVTADVMNAFNETLAATTEPKGYTTRATPEGVWSAPAGTDPKDLSKWTRLGDLADFTLNMEFPKLMDYMAARQHFSAHAPEPSARVTRVRRLPASGSHGHAASTFTRVGKTINGLSIWHEDAQPDSTVLWGWPDVVRHGAEEIRP